jgi:polar amino acid transport system permease protein
MDSSLQFLPLLGSGLLVTIALAVSSIVGGSVLGLALAYVRARKFKIVNVFIALFVDVFRCVPPILVLFILYYGLPFIRGGITLSAFAASWLGLTLVLAASSEEMFRVGCESLAGVNRAGDKGNSFEKKGGRSLTVVRQVLRKTAPELMLQAIEIVKLTALASFIVVPELFYTAKVWNASTLSGTPYLVAGLIYFLLLWPVLRIHDRLRDRDSLVT